MKFAPWALLFLLAVMAYPFANSSVDGKWTVDYVSGLAMKTIGGAEFEFHADGANLTGNANIGMGWPGRADISNGKIDGEHISFTVFGKQPSSDGYPKMEFVGTVSGDEIKMTMTFYPDGNRSSSGRTEFEGKRHATGGRGSPIRK